MIDGEDDRLRRTASPAPPVDAVEERERGAAAGLKFDYVYSADELVRSDNVFFVCTGVTDGALLDGVKFKDGFVHTHTLVMNSATRTVREVRMKRPV